MTYWLSERILLRDIVIIRSYCTVAGVWRSRKVSGKRKVFGSRTVKETDRGRTIEKGNVCRPQSLLFSDAGEGERTASSLCPDWNGNVQKRTDIVHSSTSYDPARHLEECS